MTKPRGLGRGLGRVVGRRLQRRATRPTHPDEVRGFPTSEPTVNMSMPSNTSASRTLKPTPINPGVRSTSDGLRQLAASIEAHGIIQPITLRKVRASKFQIISGERRFRAAQQAGLTELPAYIREADDQSLLEMALVENIQRQDLESTRSWHVLSSLDGGMRLDSRVVGQTRGDGTVLGGQLPSHA